TERGDIVRAVVRAGLASEASTDAALQVARQTRESPQEAIARLAGVSAGQIRAAMAQQAGARPYQGTPDREALLALPRRLARRLGAVLVDVTDTEVQVAMTNPWDRRAVRSVQALFGRRVRPSYVEPGRLEE